MSQFTRNLAQGYVIVLAVIVALFGVPILAGGVWLLSLGGSWYYALAGLGLLVTAFFLFKRSRTAVWVYLATFLFTLVWALWEGSGRLGTGPAPGGADRSPGFGAAGHSRPRPATRWSRGAAMSSAAIVAASAGWQSVVLAHQLRRPSGARKPIDTQPDAEPRPPRRRRIRSRRRTPRQPRSPCLPCAAGGCCSGHAGTVSAQPLRETGADWPAYGGPITRCAIPPKSDHTGQRRRSREGLGVPLRGPANEQSEGKYSPENTPTQGGQQLFMCTAMGIAVSLDIRTGGEEWRFDPGVSPDAIPYGATCRGVAYISRCRTQPRATSGAARILWGTLDARLIAVDAATGQPCPDFGNNGEVNLEEVSANRTGLVLHHLCSHHRARHCRHGGAGQGCQAEDAPSGVVRGYSATTGELAWAWDLGNPGNRGAPAEGEVYTRGTPNMWTTGAADEDLDFVYLPLGNSSVDYYGSNRSDLENEYATALVAVDALTGDDVWHFQTVRRDVWDYDLGSQPSLVDFPGPNGTIPAIILASKQGDIYVLDRARVSRWCRSRTARFLQAASSPTIYRRRNPLPPSIPWRFRT